MRLAGLSLHRFEAPFRAVVRHSSAARRHADNVIVRAMAASGEAGFGEACPRSYVTGESAESVAGFFARHRAALVAQVTGLDSLRVWRDRHVAEIDTNPAAFAAIELALLDVIGREQGKSVEALLGLPPLAGPFHYSAVLGDSAWPVYRLQLRLYRRLGFRDFKLKLSANTGRNRGKLVPFRGAGGAARVRADANNLWPDAKACIAALAPLDFAWFALEEPVTANRLDQCRIVADSLGTRIILDESFLGADRLGDLARDPERWILNCRVSKLGGLTRALDLLDECRRLALPVIVGAHVGETSLLTRAGLTLAHAAGDLLVAQEGAFGTWLLREDLVDPPLMFGDGGLLRPGRCLDPTTTGLGLAVDVGKLSGAGDGDYDTIA
jgi:L-alanine-DL-glutamate epimerase-like enolase superfamily enzyme